MAEDKWLPLTPQFKNMTMRVYGNYAVFSRDAWATIARWQTGHLLLEYSSRNPRRIALSPGTGAEESSVPIRASTQRISALPFRHLLGGDSAVTVALTENGNRLVGEFPPVKGADPSRMGAAAGNRAAGEASSTG